MNINVEKLPECKATMRVEVPADNVSSAREKITSTVAKQVKVPGFRPGKVPRSVVEKRFSGTINEQLSEQLVNEGCREGFKTDDLDVLSVDTVDETVFGDDGTFSFVAHLTTKPAFELPDYKGIKVQSPKLEVSDEDVDKQIENYRERFADFNDVEGREVATGDICVIDYKGSIDGKTVGEVLPKANAYLAQNHDYWMKVDEKVFLPGFTEQLVGAAVGDEREVKVSIPDDFPMEDARGMEVVYAVTVKGVKEQLLPEVDDELAGKIEPGKTIAELRESVAEQLKTEQERRVEDFKADQIVGFLNGNLEFDLPAEMLKQETQAQVDQMVERGQQQGMEEDDLVGQQEAIFSAATQQAKTHVKTSFILHEIAKEEGLEVEDNELLQRIQLMASHYKTPIKKFVKDLQKNNQIPRIREGMLVRKTLDFLKENAEVTEVDAAELAASQAAAAEAQAQA